MKVTGHEMRVMAAVKEVEGHDARRRKRIEMAVVILVLVLVSAFYVTSLGVFHQTPTTTSSTSATISSSSTSTSQSTGGSSTSSADYQLLIQPNLAKVEALREWFMSPMNVTSQKAGYDPTFGMIRGGYWGGGFQHGFVLIDTQLILAKSLDYFNSLNGVHTNIEGNLSSWLANSFINPSTGAVGTYNGTDRREVLFGKILGCIEDDSGQVYYVEGHTLSDPIPITTALPTSCTTDTQGGMNIYAPWIELYYLQGNSQKAQAMFNVTLGAWTSTPGTGIGHTTGGYFSDTFDSGPSQGKCKSSRTLGYWLEMARATGYWDLNNQTRTMTEQVMHELWAHQEPDGSISVNYPGCKNDVKASGESSGLTLVAFDPRVPSWFKSGVVTAPQLSSQIPFQQITWGVSASQSEAMNLTLCVLKNGSPSPEVPIQYNRHR